MKDDYRFRWMKVQKSTENKHSNPLHDDYPIFDHQFHENEKQQISWVAKENVKRLPTMLEIGITLQWEEVVSNSIGERVKCDKNQDSLVSLISTFNYNIFFFFIIFIIQLLIYWLCKCSIFFFSFMPIPPSILHSILSVIKVWCNFKMFEIQMYRSLEMWICMKNKSFLNNNKI